MRTMYTVMLLVSATAWTIAGFLTHPIVGWVVVALLSLLFSVAAYVVYKQEEE